MQNCRSSGNLGYEAIFHCESPYLSDNFAVLGYPVHTAQQEAMQKFFQRNTKLSLIFLYLCGTNWLVK
jgi:hypothetical protein